MSTPKLNIADLEISLPLVVPASPSTRAARRAPLSHTKCIRLSCYVSNEMVFASNLHRYRLSLLGKTAVAIGSVPAFASYVRYTIYQSFGRRGLLHACDSVMAPCTNSVGFGKLSCKRSYSRAIYDGGDETQNYTASAQLFFVRVPDRVHVKHRDDRPTWLYILCSVDSTRDEGQLYRNALHPK